VVVKVERESSFVGGVWEVNWPATKLKFRNAGRCGGRGHQGGHSDCGPGPKPEPCLPRTAMAANTLPARNEEYATQEYWCALLIQILCSANPSRISGTGDTLSERLPKGRSRLTIPCFGREAEDATFDWFKRYEDVAHLLHQVLPDKTARILMLGCGNSTLSEDVRFISSCTKTPVTTAPDV
jgi:hypothetical protein